MHDIETISHNVEIFHYRRNDVYSNKCIKYNFSYLIELH